jgi:hypothetical protein
MANSSRGRGEPATALWAVGALVVIGVFVAWLSITAEPSVAPTVAPDTAQPPGGATGTRQVTAAEFEPNAESFNGQTIELMDVLVQQQMGTALMWVELPSGSPYLVKVSDALAASGGLPAAQSRVNVQGTVTEKTTAVLDGWQQAGLLANSGQRQQAEFGSSYIEATAIRPAR